MEFTEGSRMMTEEDLDERPVPLVPGPGMADPAFPSSPTERADRIVVTPEAMTLHRKAALDPLMSFAPVVSPAPLLRDYLSGLGARSADSLAVSLLVAGCALMFAWGWSHGSARNLTTPSTRVADAALRGECGAGHSGCEGDWFSLDTRLRLHNQSTIKRGG